MIARIQRPKIFSRVGRCVYCHDEANLTDEHIIPLALNGAMILPAASCYRCATTTKKFEQVCARTIFGPFRIRQGMRTRHKKQRPQELLVDVTVPDGQKVKQSVNIDSYPDILFFLKFGHVANILYGSPDVDTSDVRPWIWAGSDLSGKTGWELGKFDAFAFARLLAKIAHCWTVAELGLNSFTPLALDFIFGRTNNLSRVVGGILDVEPPTSSLHWLQLRSQLDIPSLRHFIVVHIRLFGCCGAPTYHVVVGEVPWAYSPIGTRGSRRTSVDPILSGLI